LVPDDIVVVSAITDGGGFRGGVMQAAWCMLRVFRCKTYSPLAVVVVGDGLPWRGGGCFNGYGGV
jgi:hypothetical protein